MVKFIALYSKPEDPKAFDDRYLNGHIPLAAKIPGLRRMELSRIKGSPGGEPRYYLMAELYFNSHEALNAGLKSEQGKAVGKDVMSFAGKLVHMMVADVESPAT